MKILFFVSNRAHCVTAECILNHFNLKKERCCAEFIVQDHYINTRSGLYLKKLGYHIHNLPRVDDRDKSLWNSPGCQERNYKDIKKFYYRILVHHKPDIVIIVPYERGLFAVQLIRECKKQDIATLLLQEGLVITDENKEACLTDKPFEYFYAGNKSDKKSYLNHGGVKTLLSKLPLYMGKFKHLKNPLQIITSVKHLKNRWIRRQFPTINPFGLNGTDYVGTLAPYYSSKLIERGLSDKQVRAVGLTRFDRIVSFQRDNLEAFTWPQPADKSQIRILYPQVWGYGFGGAPSAFNSIEGELKLLSRIADSFDDGNGRITYRLRHEEDINKYHEFIKRLKSITFEEANAIPAYNSIISHDILISTGSTMLLEALALKRYCILYSPLRKDHYGYVNSGSCLMAWDSATIIKAIQQIIESTDIQQGLQKNSANYIKDRAMIDGRASERTYQFIEDIVHIEVKKGLDTR